MLLTELVDLDRIRTTKRSTDPSTFPERMAGKNKEELGSGVSAVAFKSDKPNTVNKVSYHSNPNDGYIKYIKEIMKKKDNPFFPRIYNAKIYKEGNQYALYMQMEKLLPLPIPSDENPSPKLEGMGERLFSNLGLDWKYYSREIWEDPRKLVKLAKETNNPQFAEAIKVIYPLTLRYGSDLHRKNFMIRLTGVGPQLVVTDPVTPSLAVYDPYAKKQKKTPVPPSDEDGDVTPQT